MNQCLANGTFPDKWKIANLVLIKKPGKPDGVPNAYRPLCLLDTFGKLLEQLLRDRLHRSLQQRGAIHPRQHGFCPGRSTIDAGNAVRTFCADWSKSIPMVILLDVKNAFNSAPWRRILAKLKEVDVEPYLRRIIGSYLSDRKVVAQDTEGRQEIMITSGVPQGSILGPELWNVLYSGVLDLDLPEGCEGNAYADDYALKVEGATENEVKVGRRQHTGASTIG